MPPVRLFHEDAPGFYEPQNEDQEALFRSQGWTDEPPAESSEPTSASGSSNTDGSTPADTKKENR